MANKMTNRKALAYVLENMADIPADVREKLENMAASLDNKATNTKRKPTKTQQENAVHRENIMVLLTANPNRLFTCTEIGKEVPELNGQQNQKISALMRALVDEGRVTKVTDKGKSLFQLAPDTEPEDEGEGE